MARVLMYSTGVCPYCVMAERLLTRKGVTQIEKIRVDVDQDKLSEMMEKTGSDVPASDTTKCMNRRLWSSSSVAFVRSRTFSHSFME